ncbi:MAG: CDP-diacylglycerol--serine O-phosphatidyltransferase, partial [Candidatus Edwardsbacteria bacterium]|nr:CDP-diacylglycerol--serine O-phosphatidyltransferase [Candidatus Edwardsbacteria bacterium]
MASKIKPTFLPSVFTSGNLFCGMYAIMEAMRGNSYRGAWFVILAAFFDAVDGMVARLTGQASRFGVEFDSLSDVISFVLAPMVLVYPLCFQQCGILGAVMAFAFVVTGTIRLARFNVEAKSLTIKSAFRGLPTPAAGCLVAGYLIFSRYIAGEIVWPAYLPPAILLMALLMVSTVEYPTFPKIAYRSIDSYVVYGIMVLAVIGLAVRPQLTIFPALF